MLAKKKNEMHAVEILPVHILEIEGKNDYSIIPVLKKRHYVHFIDI